MEPSFSRYIWKHTHAQQIWILVVVALSMLPYYLAFDLPKLIVNGPIMGTGFEETGATQPIGPVSVDLPWFGTVDLGGGLQLDRLDTLVGLSLAFLSLVIINGLFKYYINIYKGLLGERLLRRIRFELMDRILRFQPQSFRQIKGGEVASMVKDEVEPLGGFTGDAFVQPALLGGQALTALVFIFVQNLWLGTIALGMVCLQFIIIPRLRRQLIELGRERQLTARQLAGRVSEIVDGVNAIRVNDTSNYERADISHRLGIIFRIRYLIYKRKFLVKFLNNFLSQLTPFLFYTIGGYFTIRGELDVGQLVAVINAYKELPGPLKELIDWDLTRQDVQVKYEQVVEQFQSANMVDRVLQAPDPKQDLRLRLPLSVTNLTIEDDSGSKRLDHVTLHVEPGEAVAVVGDTASGADALAEALARLTMPVAGRIMLGDQDINSLPESAAARRITYASSDTYFFSGSLKENLLYGLKHAPVGQVVHDGQAANDRRREAIEARKSGNPDFDPADEWIDPLSATAVSESDGLLGSMMAVLDIVRLTDQVVEFALFSTLDAKANPALADEILALRGAFRDELQRRGRANLVVPFEAGSYNSAARVLDNLLFGVFTEVKDPVGLAEGTAIFNKFIMDVGLGEALFNMGVKLAQTTVELFDDLPADHPFFERLTYMAPDEVPAYRALLQRLRGVDFGDVKLADRDRILVLSYQYIEPQNRFGLLDDALMQRIVAARELQKDIYPARLSHLFELYDAGRYLSAGTLLDNIIFGKINQKSGDADRLIREILSELMAARPGLYKQVFALGLEYHLGAAGRRLTVQQRQKLNFARALIRRSDYYIFNRALSALDSVLQEHIVRDTLEFLSGQGDDPAIVWVLVSPNFAKHFQRLIVFHDGTATEKRLDGQKQLTTENDSARRVAAQ
jgi:putative ABC transport system ATP-binding protein